MSLQIMAIVIEGVLGAGTLYFQDQVRGAISARHGDIWRSLGPEKRFLANRIAGFIWHRRDRAIGDPEPSRTTTIAVWLSFLTYAGLLICAGLLFAG